MKEDYEAINTSILNETGYWGKSGAGAILYSPKRNKFGLGLRSLNVEQPGTVGTFGGAIDGNETIEEALYKELEEEVGMLVMPIFRELCVFKDDNFKYHNFLAIIDDSLFLPELNWENDELLWLSISEIQTLENKHFGLEYILSDRESMQKLTKLEGITQNFSLSPSM